MKTIVAGRIVGSEGEYIEAAMGFGSDFAALRAASPELRAAYVEFLVDTSDPDNDIDRENIEHLRRVLGVRPPANVVLMPRRGTAALSAAKGGRAA
ncbi:MULTISPECIES: hypothetical protein [unclassified Streptomyces]|uniref:hypothetical protein n=1 Tax=unclassified Streptomyces TaxID=2593676 RepID=UPI00074776E7|nr:MULTISPECIES: hypothetical protein [unclassified Streptomyces]KUL73963.1 hypothetical protein ADL34_19065 [Streptomyces sp. NRRL WC-3605]KUL74378.1 hypothetical protein ADL33_17970 [Streptomyces sp. NRRL WC-3604]